ncbi:DNA-binding protein [Oscillospiraceae bacterium CM]|nr:DNA-binding protein [Oscillospiraceae bacterium CM]
MKPSALAFDTSNYTTSCAVFDGETGRNSGRLLDVPVGNLGLRQSDALFMHVRRLPSVFEALGDLGDIIAVGASTKPRETEESYMPCFLAGESQSAVLARALGVPFFDFSHQQGHIAAAAWSSGRIDLLDMPHLAWHLSGGTTELLSVVPFGSALRCEIVGGTSDVSAGQLVDRAGQLLGLPFPSGRALDALAQTSDAARCFEPKINGLTFSLSGVEHQMKQLSASGAPPADIARFALLSVIAAIRQTTETAVKKYGGLPVLFSGGVASNTLLRERLSGGIFAEPQYSVDNALGVAILTYRAVDAHG